MFIKKEKFRNFEFNRLVFEVGGGGEAAATPVDDIPDEPIPEEKIPTVEELEAARAAEKGVAIQQPDATRFAGEKEALDHEERVGGMVQALAPNATVPGVSGISPVPGLQSQLKWYEEKGQEKGNEEGKEVLDPEKMKIAGEIINGMGAKTKVQIMKLNDPNFEDGKVASITPQDLQKAIESNEQLAGLMNQLDLKPGQTEFTPENHDEIGKALAQTLGVSEIKEADGKEMASLQNELPKELFEKYGVDGMRILSKTHEIKQVDGKGMIKMGEDWKVISELNEADVTSAMLDEPLDPNRDIGEQLKERLDLVTNAQVLNEILTGNFEKEGKKGGRFGEYEGWFGFIMYALASYAKNKDSGDFSFVADISRAFKDMKEKKISPEEGQEQAGEHYLQVAEGLAEKNGYGDTNALMDLYKKADRSDDVPKDVGYPDKAREAVIQVLGSKLSAVDQIQGIEGNKILCSIGSDDYQVVVRPGALSDQVTLYKVTEAGGEDGDARLTKLGSENAVGLTGLNEVLARLTGSEVDPVGVGIQGEGGPDAVDSAPTDEAAEGKGEPYGGSDEGGGASTDSSGSDDQ